MNRRVAVLLLAAGCGTTPAAGSEGSTGDPSPSGSTTTTGSSTSTTNFLSEGSSSTTDLDETVGVSFITDPDGGPRSVECSIFEQDCPRGEKCNPWANDGGNAWNAAKCVPLDPNPDGIGEPCTIDTAGLSGIDSCERGAMCWFIETDIEGSVTGQCVSHCAGPLNAPTCEDPNSTCVLTRFLALCIPSCDPLVVDQCGAGEGCYPLDNRFECQPDTSGKAGGVFQSCEVATRCDPGSVCMAADFVGLCEPGVSECCSPSCDLAAPTCPNGTQCVAYFEEGTTPPSYEDVGVCGQEPR